MRKRIMNLLNPTAAQVGMLTIFLTAGATVATAQEAAATQEPVQAPTQVAAAPTKIGVIDVRRLVGESEAGKQAFAEIGALQTAKTAELEAASSALEQLQTQITEGRLSLSQERLNELNRELEDGTTAYRREVQDAERELQEAQGQSLGTIEREVVPLIQQIGQEQGFAVILSITDGGVVYAPEQVNITDLVVQRYNSLKASETTASSEG